MFTDWWDWDSNSGPLIPEPYCLRETGKAIIFNEKKKKKTESILDLESKQFDLNSALLFIGVLLN